MPHFKLRRSGLLPFFETPPRDHLPFRFVSPGREISSCELEHLYPHPKRQDTLKQNHSSVTSDRSVHGSYIQIPQPKTKQCQGCYYHPPGPATAPDYCNASIKTMAFTVLACSCTSLLVHLLLQRFQESGPVLRRPAPVPLNLKKIRTREQKYAFRPKDG